MSAGFDDLAELGPFEGFAALAALVNLAVLAVAVYRLALRPLMSAADTGLPDRRRAASETRKILHAVARHANDGLVYSAMDGRILWANDAYCRIMGHDLDDIIGRRPQEFCFPPGEGPSREEIERFRFDPAASEFRELTRHMNMRKNGERFWHEFNLSLVETEDGEQRVILVSRDVSEQVAREQDLERARSELHHAAHHDALTGLVNRTAFRQAANAHLHETGPLGLLYIDLDRFKSINDTHGHPAGDAALLHVSEAIRAIVPDVRFACRIGGDEFLVACPGIDDLAALELVADALLDGIGRPFPFRDITLRTEASIGLAIGDAATGGIENLIRMADFALYKAKSPGAPRIVRYDAELHARQEAERETIEEFVEALGNGGIEFVYQPILEAGSRRATGFETLARWRRRDGSLVTPDAFLGHAARLNRLGDIDFAAIRAAASLTADIRALGLDVTGTFNTSPESLAHPGFLERLRTEIASARLSPGCLDVEVLETTFLGPDTRGSPAAARICELRRLGFSVFLDDFGVGYAGLAHLGQLDVTGIKIDRSLVCDILRDRSTRLIATSILQLCRELSIEPVAEGIETAEQADLLVSLGCARLQGYAIARPMQRDAVLDWFARSGDRPLVIGDPGLARAV